MKHCSRFFFILLSLFLCACADDVDKPDENKKPEVQNSVSVEKAADETSARDESVDIVDKEKNNIPPLSLEEAKLANRAIAFGNRARDVLNSGIYSTADTLNDNARRYKETWFLPKRPKLPAKYNTDASLKAPSRIFSQSEEASLTAALDGMDKALNELLRHYKALEKYIGDSSIVDDGKKGLELSDKIFQSHTRYMSAKRTWMEIVEAKAEEAEAKLLREHPLERQILSARNIFAQMEEIRDIIIAEPDNRQVLAGLAQNLNSIIEQAGQPPFQASATLERLYKAFLKDAGTYTRVLNRGLLEGFYNVQRRELNEASIKCRDAYNEFVRVANRLSDSPVSK